MVQAEIEMLSAGIAEGVGDAKYTTRGEARLAAADALVVFAEADQQIYDGKLRRLEGRVNLRGQYSSVRRSARATATKAFFHGDREKFRQYAGAAGRIRQNQRQDRKELRQLRRDVGYYGHNVEWSTRTFHAGDGNWGFTTPLPGGPPRESVVRGEDGSSTIQRIQPSWMPLPSARFHVGLPYEDVGVDEIHSHPRHGDPVLRTAAEHREGAEMTDGLQPSGGSDNEGDRLSAKMHLKDNHFMLNTRGQLWLTDAGGRHVLTRVGASKALAEKDWEIGVHPSVADARRRRGSAAIDDEIEVATLVLKSIDPDLRRSRQDRRI